MKKLPTTEFCGHRISRLICGGNPLSGYSHLSAELDREMIEYYTLPNIFALLNQCWAEGITAFQSRGDRHQMRMYLEYRLNGGQMRWLAQTASEFANIRANITEIARYRPIAIYHHGTHTDNGWHTGKIDQVHDLLKAIHDHGLPAGLGTHIPEVIDYAESKGWETDFYMGCFYNLARQYKSAPAADQDAYKRDQFPAEAPPKMAAVMRRTPKPCIAFKILAASRNCASRQMLENAFRFAFENIKPNDIVNVGMFQKYKNQVQENAEITRQILAPAAERP